MGDAQASRPLGLGALRRATVLMALEDPARSQTVVDEIARELGSGSKLILVHIVDTPLWLAGGEMIAPPIDLEEEARRQLHECVATLPRDLSVTWLVRRGKMVRELVKLATQERCNAIVLSTSASRPRRRRRRVAARLHEQLNLPVLEIARAY